MRELFNIINIASENRVKLVLHYHTKNGEERITRCWASKCIEFDRLGTHENIFKEMITVVDLDKTNEKLLDGVTQDDIAKAFKTVKLSTIHKIEINDSIVFGPEGVDWIALAKSAECFRNVHAIIRQEV